MPQCLNIHVCFFKDRRAISTDLVLLNLTETLFVHKSILKCHHCANAMRNCSSDKANRKMYKKHPSSLNLSSTNWK